MENSIGSVHVFSQKAFGAMAILGEGVGRAGERGSRERGGEGSFQLDKAAILVAGKGRGEMFFYFFCFITHSCSSFLPVPLFHLLYLLYLFSAFSWESTQNDPEGLTSRYNPIKKATLVVRGRRQ